MVSNCPTRTTCGAGGAKAHKDSSFFHALEFRPASYSNKTIPLAELFSSEGELLNSGGVASGTSGSLCFLISSIIAGLSTQIRSAGFLLAQGCSATISNPITKHPVTLIIEWAWLSGVATKSSAERLGMGAMSGAEDRLQPDTERKTARQDTAKTSQVVITDLRGLL